MMRSIHAAIDLWRSTVTVLRAWARLRRQQAARTRTARLRYVPEEQLIYADTLESGVRIGRLLLVLTFALYAFGLMDPKVPFEDLPTFWTMPVSAYLRGLGIDAGWHWVLLIGHGDFANFIGIAFLAGLTCVCYGRVLPIGLERKDNIFTTILILQIAVLVLAASGLLSFGH